MTGRPQVAKPPHGRSGAPAPVPEATPLRPPNPNARVWLFDFDNTIAELEPMVDWAGSRQELEAYLRSAGVGDAIFAEFPRGNLVLYEALRGRLLDGTGGDSAAVSSRADAEAMLLHASEIIERHELLGIERALPLAGATELLRAHAPPNNSVVVVTSNSSRTVTQWLELHRVSAVVPLIVGRDTLLALKPSHHMVMRALERLGVTAEEAVFVGDSEADFRASQAAGVGFYGIGAKPAARERLIALGAAHVFESPYGLATHLELVTAD